MNDSFGCDRCWPQSAAAAAEVRASLENRHALVTSNHLDVTICVCAACGQRFVSVFLEDMNFSGEDDSFATFRIPVTEEESTSLIGLDAPSVISAVNGLDGRRRSLVRTVIGGNDGHVRWDAGIQIQA